MCGAFFRRRKPAPGAGEACPSAGWSPPCVDGRWQVAGHCQLVALPGGCGWPLSRGALPTPMPPNSNLQWHFLDFLLLSCHFGLADIHPWYFFGSTGAWLAGFGFPSSFHRHPTKVALQLPQPALLQGAKICVIARVK